MSGAEILYRVQQKLRTQRERSRTARPWPADLALSQGLDLQGNRPVVTLDPNARLLEPWRREQLQRLFPEERSRLRREADAVLAGRLKLFGHEEVAVGTSTDWHQDPCNGRTWPRTRFYADIDIRSGGAKTIWEASRHQHLSAVALCGWLEDDDRYGRFVIEQLRSWWEQNPAYTGVHWASGLEVALRLVSWTWIRAALDERLADAPFWKEWSRSIVAHGTYLADHQSAYSSANNHLIGEAVGLVSAAALLPQWPAAASWKSTGLQILEAEFERQIHPDGVPAEQAFHYLGFVLDLYFHAGRLAGADWLQSATRSRLGSIATFFGAMANASGDLPSIGDEDGGRALRLSPDEPTTRSRMAMVAAVGDRSDLKPRALLDPNAWWLLDEASIDRFLSAPSGDTPASECFAAGGYAACRFGEPARERLLVFDFGPLGYTSIAAHGHADCLSVCLSVDGYWLLTDPGTYVYHEEPEWRRYFRSTRAHNTVSIDGEDQSLQTGTTMWTFHAKPGLIDCRLDQPYRWIEAQHDGYSRLGPPALHRRAVACSDKGYLLIFDWIVSSRPRSFQATFQLGERAQATVAGNGAQVVCGDTNAAVLALTGARVQLHRGATEPPAGWISPSFRAKHAAPMISLDATGDHLITAVVTDAAAMPTFNVVADQGAWRLDVHSSSWREHWTVSRKPSGDSGTSLLTHHLSEETVSNGQRAN